MNAPIFPSVLSTRFCIVRHGETDWNAARRIQGQTDIPLNATGHRQALAAARGLAKHQFAALYSSDLQRARDTAAAAAQLLQLAVIPAPGLRERHYGSFQGLTKAEAAQQRPDDFVRYHAREVDFSFGHGESLSAFAKRIEATLNELAVRHPGQTLLLVAHGGVLDVIYRKATQRPLHTPRDFPIPNAALNWLSISPAGWAIEHWGEQSHLESALELVTE